MNRCVQGLLRICHRSTIFAVVVQQMFRKVLFRDIDTPFHSYKDALKWAGICANKILHFERQKVLWIVMHTHLGNCFSEVRKWPTNTTWTRSSLAGGFSKSALLVAALLTDTFLFLFWCHIVRNYHEHYPNRFKSSTRKEAEQPTK